MRKRVEKEQLENAWDKFIKEIENSDDEIQSYIDGYNITKAHISVCLSTAKEKLRRFEELLKKY